MLKKDAIIRATRATFSIWFKKKKKQKVNQPIIAPKRLEVMQNLQVPSLLFALLLLPQPEHPMFLFFLFWRPYINSYTYIKTT